MKILEKLAAKRQFHRDVKRRVVEMLMSCAEIAPFAVKKSRKLNGDQAGRITLLGGEFWRDLSVADKGLLASVKPKGFSVPQAGVRANYDSLADFLTVPTLSIEEAGCMAAWTELGFEWAELLVQRNPHTFPEGWGVFARRLKNAIMAEKVSNEQFIKNPYGQGLPKNAEQAFAYMIFKAGYIPFENQDLPKHKVEETWKRLYNTEVPTEFRQGNVEVLFNKGYEEAKRRCLEQYGI